jgi:integrase
VDLIEDCIYQDAREVKTKFSKSFTTCFNPVGDEIREIVAEWVRYLRETKLWGNDDPLFPATRVQLGKARQFAACGLAQKHWSTAAPIRTIFREAFEQAGLPYFHPHSLRMTLARLAEQLCHTPEELKAWSQNMGHEKVLTTLMSYGTVPTHRQHEIMRALGTARPSAQSSSEVIAEAVKMLQSALPDNSLKR